MKVTLKKTVETTEEMEITFPYYFKQGGSLYAILSESNALEVSDFQINKWRYADTVFKYIAKPGVEVIAVEEFITAFDARIEELQQALKTNLSQTKNQ